MFSKVNSLGLFQRVQFLCKREKDTLANLKMENVMVKGNKYGKIIHCMKANGRMVKQMVKVE